MTKNLDNLGVIAHMENYAGTPILHFQRKGDPFTVNLMFDFGAYGEDKVSEAHFLEHMVLSGGKKYPSKKLLTDVFEDRGCGFGGTTSHFAMWIRELNNSKEDLPFAAETLEDIIINPTFDPVSVEKERNVILAEREKTGKEKQRFLSNVSLGTLFPATRFSIDVKGDSDHISSLSRADLVAAHGRLLRSKRVLVTAGDFSIDEVKKVLSSFLETIGKIEPQSKEAQHLPIRTGTFSVANPFDMAAVGIFFDRSVYGNPKKMAAHMFLNMLFFSRNGLLVQKLMYENPLAYSFPDYSISSPAADFFGTFVETMPQNVDMVRRLLVQTTTVDLFSRITAEEVEKAVRSLRARERRRYPTAEALITRYSFDYLTLGTSLAWEGELVSILEKMPIEEIISEARSVFNEKNHALIVTSPDL